MVQNNKINNDNSIKQIVEPVKTYSYCWKCGRTFLSPLSEPWCDFYCRSEYYAEIAQEENACYREWIGRD